MTNKKVSIIIPIYNKEEYLCACLDTVIKQTYKNLEIILVDDGSTDRSNEIIKKYRKNDSRIKILEKSNSGVSSARNSGIDNATGDYVMFVDPDDYISENLVETLVKELKRGECQLVQCMFRKVLNDNDIIDMNNKYTVFDYEREQAIKGIIYRKVNKIKFNRMTWGKMYCLNIIKEHKIRFNEEIYIFEDGLFNLEYVTFINNVKVIEAEGYAYRQIVTAATKRYDVNRKEQNKKILCELEKYKVRQNIDYANTEINLFGIEMLLGLMAKQIFNKKNDKSRTEKIVLLKQVIEQDYLKYINNVDTKNIDIKNKIVIFLLRKRKYTVLYIYYIIKDIKGKEKL